MIKLFLVGLALVFVLTLWTFLRSAPAGVPKRVLIWYNGGTLVTGLVLCALFSLRLKINLTEGVGTETWRTLSVAGSLVIFSTCLLVARFIRNQVLFRGGTGRK
jgi:hypothetical protein